MEKIRLDDMDLMAGLDWTALDSSVPEKKALADYLGKTKAKRGIIMRHGGLTVVGLAIGKKAPKVPSAAALLALASQKHLSDAGVGSSDMTSAEHNWIVVEALAGEEERFWMGAVKNGVPVPGSDIVGNRAYVVDEMLNIISNNPNFTVYTLDRDVRYNALGSVEVVEKKFSDLVRAVPVKKAVPALFSIAAILAVAIVVLAIVIGGSWWAYTVWDEAQQARIARERAAQQRKEAQIQAATTAAQYESQIKAAVLKGLDEGMNDIKTTLESPGSMSTVYAWRDLVYSIDAYQSGWELQGADCMVEETIPKCKVRLSRGSMGINRFLLEDHPDAIIEGDAASYVIAGQALPGRQSNMQVIGSGVDFEKTILSELQILRSVDIGHTSGASKELVKEVDIPPMTTMLSKAGDVAPAAAPEPPKPISIQLGFANGTLSVTGKQMWQMSGVARYLDGTNVRVKDMTIQLKPGSDTSSWTINADYLVRTLPQPIIPPVRSGEQTINVKLPEQYRSAIPVEEGGVGESNITAVAPAGATEAPEGTDPNAPTSAPPANAPAP